MDRHRLMGVTSWQAASLIGLKQRIEQLEREIFQQKAGALQGLKGNARCRGEWFIANAASKKGFQSAHRSADSGIAVGL